MPKPEALISIVVPVYNEAGGLKLFHESLVKSLASVDAARFELIYCDDGSTDQTADVVHELHDKDSRVKLIKLSRNFGKENALAAGIAEASGQAIIMIDGDGQHPVEMLPEFVAAWRHGAQVVIGVYRRGRHASLGKRLGSWLFHHAFNRSTKQKVARGTTDFRLIDRAVQQAFLQLPETDRLTRGLIDWLGFRREFIPVHLKAREHGATGQSYGKLVRLFTNSLVSLTTGPLYFFGLLGIFITTMAFILGTAVIIEQLILGDPLHWKFTGTAMLSIMVLFLVGIVLLSQGILSLYVSHIHNQTKQRPLYVIDYETSAGLREKHHD